jgi:glutamate--cysteine ligase
MTPHPRALGSALTHPHITTDFCEAQLELITGVHPSAQACMDEITQIHQVVFRNIEDEMLWCASMPCGLPGDDAIPIGQYGTSNIGRAKSVYRAGLGLPLRPAHADDLGHPLQLLASRRGVAIARLRRPRTKATSR